MNETCKYTSQKGKQIEFAVKELENLLGVSIILECHTLTIIRLYWSVDDQMVVDLEISAPKWQPVVLQSFISYTNYIRLLIT